MFDVDGVKNYTLGPLFYSCVALGGFAIDNGQRQNRLFDINLLSPLLSFFATLTYCRNLPSSRTPRTSFTSLSSLPYLTSTHFYSVTFTLIHISNKAHPFSTVLLESQIGGPSISHRLGRHTTQKKLSLSSIDNEQSISQPSKDIYRIIAFSFPLSLSLTTLRNAHIQISIPLRLDQARTISSPSVPFHKHARIGQARLICSLNYSLGAPGKQQQPQQQQASNQHQNRHHRPTNQPTNNNKQHSKQGMVRLGRNRSLPVPPSHGATMRKANTNVFSFPTLTLTRTLSERSNEGGNNSRSSSLSRSISRTRSGSSAPIPLAPIIAAIQRGNFVKLSEMDIEALLDDMSGKNSKVLEALNITSASISASDAKILAKLIKSSDTANIKTLKMEGNTISQQASKLMFEGWKFNKTISTLSLARSGVNDKTVKYLARVVVKNEVLKTLDLSGNHITALGAEYLADAMVQNRSITRLCIQSNNIRKAGAPFIAKILNKNRVVRHLNMGSNGLGADGVSIIAESVRFNRTLTSLSLDMNEMGSKGANAIATALISNRHLTHLYMPHNNIGDMGLADLCESLKRNRTLISLDLELNHIGKGQSAVGLKALGELLLVSTTLREINLSFNLFSAEAIAALAAGMCKNSTLESVLLNNCCLPTEAAVSLSKVLSSPSTGLQNLGLTNNAEIGVEGYWALASNLIRNRSLKGIQLDYNSDDRQALYESFQNSLTRNHIWQQAIYAAACRILFLSRIVLLGRPANQKQLQRQQDHHIKNHQQHGWNIFRRVKMGRTNSSNSLASLLTIGKSHRSNGADGGGHEGDIGTNMSHSNSHARHISTATSASAASTIAVVTNSNGSVHGASSSHHHHALSHRPSISSTTSASVSTTVEYEYNPHKILANLCNMPHEIFESICAFLDPGRTMNIAQIRMTVQTAGDRSTLTRYYTRERMLERIFHSRYISPLGTRYSLKHGDERT